MPEIKQRFPIQKILWSKGQKLAEDVLIDFIGEEAHQALRIHGELKKLVFGPMSLLRHE